MVKVLYKAHIDDNNPSEETFGNVDSYEYDESVESMESDESDLKKKYLEESQESYEEEDEKY